MNVYFIDAGEMQVFQEYIADTARYEREGIIALVVAETRGKARQAMCYQYDVEFTYKMSIHLIERDCDLSPRIIGVWDDGHENWWHIANQFIFPNKWED